MGRADLAGPQRRGRSERWPAISTWKSRFGPRQAAQAMLTRTPQFHSDR